MMPAGEDSANASSHVLQDGETIQAKRRIRASSSSSPIRDKIVPIFAPSSLCLEQNQLPA